MPRTPPPPSDAILAPSQRARRAKGEKGRKAPGIEEGSDATGTSTADTARVVMAARVGAVRATGVSVPGCEDARTRAAILKHFSAAVRRCAAEGIRTAAVVHHLPAA